MACASSSTGYVAGTLIDALKAFGGMRAVSDQFTTNGGNDMSYPTSDGTAEVGEQVAQNVAAAAADIVFGTAPVNTYKFGSKTITIPIELLQDTEIDLVGLVMTRMRQRIGRIQNQRFSIGTGSSQPFGVSVAAAVGKTGTKEALFAALDRGTPGRVHRSVKSYNNHTGVPLSLARSSSSNHSWGFLRASSRICQNSLRPFGVPSEHLRNAQVAHVDRALLVMLRGVPNSDP